MCIRDRLSTGHRPVESRSLGRWRGRESPARLFCPLPPGPSVWLPHPRLPGPGCGSLKRRSPPSFRPVRTTRLCAPPPPSPSHTQHILLVHRTHTVPRLDLPNLSRSQCRLAPSRSSRREYLSARARRASKQLIVALVVRSPARCRWPHPRLDSDSSFTWIACDSIT